MIKKEYYRLEELAKQFDVTFDAVRYWVEAGELNLAFHVNNKKFVLGGWQKGKGFIAFGVANYRGLVSISANEQLELIEKNGVKCRNFKLLNKSAITNLILDHPFKSTIPNKLLAEWRPKTVEQIVWDLVPARICPSEKQNSLKKAGQMFLNTLEKVGEKDGSNVEVDTKAYNGFSDYQFDFNDVELTIKDICIPFDDLIKLGVIKPEESRVDTTKLTGLSSGKSKSTRTDDFNDLLLEIIKSQPELSAKEYWRIIEDENTTPEGSRVYDNHNLIKSISDADAIEWHDKKGKPRKSMFFAAFSNRITRMKKLLFPNENS